METNQEHASNSLEQRLNDPETVRTLHRLLDRAGEFESLLATTASIKRSAPDLAAIAADTVDEACRRAGEQGIHVEERIEGLVRMLLRLTEPQTLSAAEGLLGRLGKLDQASQLMDQLPDLMAMAMDVFDEWAGKLKAEGIELESCVLQGLRAVLWLAQRISEVELDRLGTLLRSDILAEDTIAALGIAGTSLAKCHDACCRAESPPKVGLMGLLSALRDPNVQRAVGFVLQFVRCFGDALNERDKE